MDARIDILSGARAGETLSFAQQSIAVGRHPQVDLRFDPASDRAVSARHAILFHENGAWHVRDLGSRNGTFVNGRRVAEDLRLRNGDRITFGLRGPTVKIAFEGGSLEGIAATGDDARTPQGTSTLDRVRLELTRPSRYWAATIALSVLLFAAAGAALVVGDRQRAAWEREGATRLQIDSVQGAGDQAVRTLRRQLDELTSSMRQSEQRIAALQAQISAVGGDDDSARVEGLRRQLDAETSGLRNRVAAAALPFASIQERNRHATARIYVEYANGEVATGTAISVASNATLITNRHIMVDATGQVRPRRVSIQFSDSEQVWPARLLAESNVDLAVVRVETIDGPVPEVHRLNLRPDTLRPGSPVAMLGFPPAGGPGNPEQTLGFARPRLAAGVVQEASAGRVHVRGYGAVPGSGSAVLDRNGELVAILFGGLPEADGYSMFGVPASAAAQLLGKLP